jgi:hypothetical protein
MGCNRLQRTEEDRINTILCAAGMNFWKLERFAAAFLRQLLLHDFGGYRLFSDRFVFKEPAYNTATQKITFSGSNK